MSTESSTDSMTPPDAPSVELPIDKELVLKVIPMPGDCNANGDIFGGWVMSQVDLAGAVLPARYVDGRMATVAVNQFIFKQPVRRVIGVRRQFHHDAKHRTRRACQGHDEFGL